MIYEISIKSETGENKLEVREYNDFKRQLSDALDSLVGFEEGTATVTVRHKEESPTDGNQ